MKEKRILKLYLDESGDPGAFSRRSPVYSLGFAVLEPNVDISEQERRFKEAIARINGGEFYVHTGKLIRNEKPYQGILPEDRRKLFWHLFFFTIHTPISLFAIHCRKDRVKTDDSSFSLQFLLVQEFRLWCLNHFDYLKSFDSLRIHYDYGQPFIESLVLSVLAEIGIDAEFVKCQQDENVLLQVADLACEAEYMRFKYKEGSFTHSEREFFGERAKLKKDLLNPIKKKFI